MPEVWDVRKTCSKVVHASTPPGALQIPGGTATCCSGQGGRKRRAPQAELLCTLRLYLQTGARGLGREWGTHGHDRLARDQDRPRGWKRGISVAETRVSHSLQGQALALGVVGRAAGLLSDTEPPQDTLPARAWTEEARWKVSPVPRSCCPRECAGLVSESLSSLPPHQPLDLSDQGACHRPYLSDQGACQWRSRWLALPLWLRRGLLLWLLRGLSHHCSSQGLLTGGGVVDCRGSIGVHEGLACKGTTAWSW